MNKKERIILFDGVCNICDASVQFIIKRDKHAKFKFAPLQSKLAKKYKQKIENVDSLVLIEEEEIYIESTAALKICKNLDGFWKLFYVFILIPKPIRDKVYRMIAKNRYKWFGQKETCIIPTKEIKERFVEN